jgi:hypothetical protein
MERESERDSERNLSCLRERDKEEKKRVRTLPQQSLARGSENVAMGKEEGV